MKPSKKQFVFKSAKYTLIQSVVIIGGISELDKLYLLSNDKQIKK